MSTCSKPETESSDKMGSLKTDTIVLWDGITRHHNLSSIFVT